MRPSLQGALSLVLAAAGMGSGPARADAQPQAAAAFAIAPGRLPRVATIDQRFQSYNVEMAEIIGGNFWKPYGPGGEVAKSPAAPLGQGVAGADPNLFQAMPPLDTANPRLRRLAAALGPAYVRISGTWANFGLLPRLGHAATGQGAARLQRRPDEGRMERSRRLRPCGRCGAGVVLHDQPGRSRRRRCLDARPGAEMARVHQSGRRQDRGGGVLQRADHAQLRRSAEGL